MKQFVLKAEDLPRFAGLYTETLANAADETTILLGAVDEQAQPPIPAGLLAARVIDGALLLEWLYVAPECRRQGVAASLFNTLLNSAQQNDAVRGIAAFFSQNQPELEAFFKAVDFAVFHMDGWGQFKGTLDNVAAIPNPPAAGYSIIPLAEVPEAKLRAFNQFLLQENAPRCGVPLPILPQDYAPQSKVCYANGNIGGVILLRMQDAQIELSWLYAPMKHLRSLPLLLNAALSDVRQNMPPETPLVFGTLARPGQALAERLLPDAEWIETYIALWQF